MSTRMDPAFWRPEPMAPIPALAALRDTVLERTHARMPKWRFRLADALVVQLQPKPAERRDRYYLFDGQARGGPDVGAQDFQTRRRGVLGLAFGIVAAGGQWTLQPTWVSGGSAAGWPAWRAQVVSALGSGQLDRLSAAAMLQPACVICGKRLTDPASMARWIGPECFGRSTLAVPWLFDAVAPRLPHS